MFYQNLPAGVIVSNLTTHFDERGQFTEIYRQNWPSKPDLIQWNFLKTNEGVLRGVHVHLKHYDYVTVLDGQVAFGLKDLRPHSPTENLAVIIEMTDTTPQTLLIPPGVAHGFLMRKTSSIVYGVSHYWDKDDELGCRFDDPELGFDWEKLQPNISVRDANLPPLSQLRPLIPAYQPL